MDSHRVGTAGSDIPCPDIKAGLASRLLYSWLSDLLRKGYKRALTSNDMYKLREDYSTAFLGAQFRSVWLRHTHQRSDTARHQQQTNSKQRTLLWSLVEIYGKQFYLAGVYKFIADVTALTSPYFFGLIIKSIGSNAPEESALFGIPYSYMYALMMFGIALVSAMTMSFYNQMTFTIGLKTRTSISPAIYEKVLKLSSLGHKDFSTGNILNIMSTDAKRVEQAPAYLHYIWSGPFQLVVVMAMIYHLIGWCGLIGMLIFIMCIPIQSRIVSLLSKYRIEASQTADKRVKLMEELLQGIKAIKLYGWDDYFAKKIDQVRTHEVLQLRSVQYMVSATIFITNIVPTIACIATFVALRMVGESFTPETTLPAIAYIHRLRTPLARIPAVISQSVEAAVSLARIQAFLLTEEINHARRVVDFALFEAVRVENGNFYWSRPSAEQKPESPTSSLTALSPSSTVELLVNNTSELSFSASTSALDSMESPSDCDFGCCLKNVNITIPRGSLVAIVGTVGAGKSSLLNAILGEVAQSRGSVFIGGKTAYCPQQAWIQNASVQNNILFGSPMDRARYAAVLNSCELESDLEVFQDGDHTEIGEKGATLSGGQKQRISLARAVYSDADILLLDDPLSAVDAQVGRAIFEKCIVNFAKQTTRIMSISSVHLLPEFDLILLVEDGRIVENGPFDILSLTPNSRLSDLMSRFGNVASTVSANNSKNVNSNSTISIFSAHEDSIKLLDRSRYLLSPRNFELLDSLSGGNEGDDDIPSVVSEQLAGTDDEEDNNNNNNNSKSNRNTEEEDNGGVENADVNDALALAKMKDCDSSRGIPFAHKKTCSSSVSLPGCSAACCNALLAAEPSTPAPSARKLMTAEERSFGAISNSIYSEYFGYSGGLKFLLPAVGSIIMYNIAKMAGDTWLSYYSTSEHTISANAFSIVYISIGLLVGLFSICNVLMFTISGLLAATRLHNKALHGIIRSPMRFFDTTPLGRILARFSNDQDTIDSLLPRTVHNFFSRLAVMLSGLAVVAIVSPAFIVPLMPLLYIYYKIQAFFRATSRELKRVDGITRSPIFSHFSETLSGLSSIRAFCAEHRLARQYDTILDVHNQPVFLQNATKIWLRVRLELIGNCIVLSAAFCCIAFQRSVVLAGLATGYSLGVTVAMNWCIRQATEAENQIFSSERLSQYANRLCSEAPEVIDGNTPAAEWPSKGSIEFSNVVVQYRPGLPLALSGITAHIYPREKVGIVGRTGSGKSTLMMAMFRIVEPKSGIIQVDGIDIQTIGLHDLRTRLSVIPQDPVIFSGTIRSNLDPREEYSDAQIWSALGRSHLKNLVMSSEAKLDFVINEGGSNLSVGQRQLLCLARALLRNSRVLILDEATANIDLETDELIQKCIRTDFANSTVLTIAHRIGTVIDNDRIMVIDDGRLVEFDRPAVLLRNPASLLSRLVRETDIAQHVKQ